MARNPYPSETHFRACDWRPGKRRRSRPRLRDYGGQKVAPLGLLMARMESGFGKGPQRRCALERCNGWAVKESLYCRAHGGARAASQAGAYIPRRLKERRAEAAALERLEAEAEQSSSDSS